MLVLIICKLKEGRTNSGREKVETLCFRRSSGQRSDLAENKTHPSHNACLRYLQVLKGSDQPEDKWSFKRSPDTCANYKHKTWLQMTDGFSRTGFYFDM